MNLDRDERGRRRMARGGDIIRLTSGRRGVILSVFAEGGRWMVALESATGGESLLPWIPRADFAIIDRPQPGAAPAFPLIAASSDDDDTRWDRSDAWARS